MTQLKPIQKYFILPRVAFRRCLSRTASFSKAKYRQLNRVDQIAKACNRHEHLKG